MPAWHQLVPISGHVEESETARKLQLYATSIKTSVSTRLIPYQLQWGNIFIFFGVKIMKTVKISDKFEINAHNMQKLGGKFQTF